ncbi:TPA: hypothetical protein QCI12_004383 [Enterobacter roggenkampii]|nr:hypothetical protein [Enterobacter roggenkampii]
MKIQSVVKKCIFCGDKPENKNKEHVIPKWLIEMTGDKKRSGYFGFDKFTEADVAASNTLDNEMENHIVYIVLIHLLFQRVKNVIRHLVVRSQQLNQF